MCDWVGWTQQGTPPNLISSQKRKHTLMIHEPVSHHLEFVSMNIMQKNILWKIDDRKKATRGIKFFGRLKPFKSVLELVRMCTCRAVIA